VQEEPAGIAAAHQGNAGALGRGAQDRLARLLAASSRRKQARVITFLDRANICLIDVFHEGCAVEGDRLHLHFGSLQLAAEPAVPGRTPPSDFAAPALGGCGVVLLLYSFHPKIHHLLLAGMPGLATQAEQGK
jgi:hypothetical protein